MWPWEHLALSYLVASVGYRLVSGRAPTPLTVFAIGVASQLPDLIDKPLAWGLDILPSGLTLGHSLFFATAVSAVALTLAARRRRLPLGVAFTLAYGAHLLGDVLFALLTSGSLAISFLFWPVVPASPDPGVGLLARVGQLAGRFWQFLATPRGQLYLGFELLLLTSAVVLWVVDGRPGLRLVGRRLFGVPNQR